MLPTTTSSPAIFLKPHVCCLNPPRRKIYSRIYTEFTEVHTLIHIISTYCTSIPGAGREFTAYCSQNLFPQQTLSFSLNTFDPS